MLTRVLKVFNISDVSYCLYIQSILVCGHKAISFLSQPLKKKKSIIAKLEGAGIQPSFTILNLHEELHSMARVYLTSIK